MGYFIDMENKIKYFSSLRVFACFEVILLHALYTSSAINKNEILLRDYNISQTLVILLMNAVPIFVMVTGALLLSKKQPLKISILFCKYIGRILSALLVSSILFFIFDVVMDKETLSPALVLSATKKLVTGTGWSHLWYMYLLVGLYLLMPFYKKAAMHSDKKEMTYLLLVYAVAMSIMPLAKVLKVTLGFYIHVSTIYPFYMFLGYSLHNKIISVSFKKSVMFFLSGTMISLVAGYFYFFKNADNLQYFTGYSAFPILLQSIGLFGLFENAQWKENRFIYSLDQCGLWIYLIHLIFIRLIFRYWKFNPFEYENYVPVVMLCVAVMIYMVSYVTVMATREVKVLIKTLIKRDYSGNM